MKKALLVDFSHLFWQAWYSDSGTSRASSVARVKEQSEGYDLVVVCLDAPPYHRVIEYPYYKAKRDPHPPEAMEEMALASEALEQVGFITMAAEGYEADDCIFTLVNLLEPLMEVDILTRDKDLFALVSDRVKVWSTHTGARIGPEEVRKKMGVPPERVFDYLSIAGDAADGVKGAKGIGEVKARQLIAEHGTIIDILEAAERGGSRLLDLVMESKDDIIESMNLVAPREVKFDTELEQRITAAIAGTAPGNPVAKRHLRVVNTDPTDEEFKERAGFIDTVLEVAKEGLIGPPMENSDRNIYQRMNAVMREVDTIYKGSFNSHQRYKYAGHEALTSALQPQYVKHGIVRTASVVAERRSGPNDCSLHLTVAVRWTNIDEPTDFVEVLAVGEVGNLSKDPGPTPVQSGIALSYAVKNAEFKAFSVVGDDTPDAEDVDNQPRGRVR